MTERRVISEFKRQKLERRQKKRQKRTLRDTNSIGKIVQKRRQPLRVYETTIEKFKRQYQCEETVQKI